jgi:hypothetical protein
MTLDLKPLPFRGGVGVGPCPTESNVLLYFPTPTPPLKGRGL